MRDPNLDHALDDLLQRITPLEKALEPYADGLLNIGVRELNETGVSDKIKLAQFILKAQDMAEEASG